MVLRPDLMEEERDAQLAKVQARGRSWQHTVVPLCSSLSAVAQSLSLRPSRPSSQVESILAENGAIDIKLVTKGIQRIAYPIDGMWEGFMVFMTVRRAWLSRGEGQLVHLAGNVSPDAFSRDPSCLAAVHDAAERHPGVREPPVKPRRGLAGQDHALEYPQDVKHGRLSPTHVDGPLCGASRPATARDGRPLALADYCC